MQTEILYQTYKPLLFSLAYRMLGSVMDAEDIVQEVFLLLEKSEDLSSIQNIKAYLCKIVTNRSIDKLRSSAKKRELYVGTWLPEPFVEDFAKDPSSYYDTKESISTAYLLLLQQLSEVERAVFLLREVFQFNYNEIASIVGKTSANCRQIFHRANKSIMIKNHSTLQDNIDLSRFVEKFADAVQNGNITEILSMLKEDAVYYSDGGGKVNAALRPIYSADKIARFLLGIMKKIPENSTVCFKIVNGSPGIILLIDDMVQYVLSFAIKEGIIEEVYMVANPDKLIHLKHL
ncbi:RNA polymerase sigma-70 factor [Bacillus sp. FJAT-49736]|uniref:RNA polymerase sigma-70 factor n=1 Tax=Bacillus sp. FJAT-49736 TaxID=2833582 RepID=UPI001BCA361C|nr:RNA polymerase sigma-70 factor [Bacillus sp. FJAT-49736]MBS4174733.1 RNA polymerase sigma-70 factor [Bacillus sp. FJAT-49736]